MRPDIPVLNTDGMVSPVNEALSGLLSRIPEIDSRERADWRRDVLKAIGRGGLKKS
jgi:hypothetical protein